MPPAKAVEAAAEIAAARTSFFILSSRYSLAVMTHVDDKHPRLTSYLRLSSNPKQLQMHLEAERSGTAKMSSNKQHLRANFRHAEKFGDMFIVETNAAVGRASPDFARVVRAVDAVVLP